MSEEQTTRRCAEGWRLYYRIGIEYMAVIRKLDNKGADQTNRRYDWTNYDKALEAHKNHWKTCPECRKLMTAKVDQLEEAARLMEPAIA